MGFEIIRPGPGRLIRALIDQLKIIETINNTVRWDPAQWNLSPGELIASLIIAFFNKRRALYKVREFYQRQDLELLFGRKDLTADDFNDDCLGRSLDRLEETDFSKIYGLIIFEARKIHQLQMKCCHADTTSLMVYGEYEDPDQELVEYGFSKDHRSDLKQVKSGLCVDSEGIPIYGEPINGNVDDKTWNQELLKKFKEVIIKEFDMLLVADSQLVTTENLMLIRKELIRFISRFPDTFNLCDELKEQAWRNNVWQEIGLLSKHSKAASYRIQELPGEIDDWNYRFIVVNSSSLDKRKEKTLQRLITDEKERLERAVRELGKRTFACRPDAEMAVKSWVAKEAPKYHQFEVTVSEEELPVKRSQRGRPRQDEPRVTAEKAFRLGLRILGRNEAAIQRLYDHARTFVLISNDPNLSGMEILQNYKNQYKVEQRFGFLKDPYYVGPLFMKKEDRLKGLHHVLLLTLLVYSLFERKARLSLAAEGKPFHVAGSYRTFTPKAKTLLEYLDDLHIARIAGPNGTYRELPDNVCPKAKRLVALSGFSIDIYTTPPIPSWRFG
ncbi:MAG: IS1634 family transposase [Firmicutes bacterium]|nr:IS1634 family transposase [Bacillota bacterium]